MCLLLKSRTCYVIVFKVRNYATRRDAPYRDRYVLLIKTIMLNADAVTHVQIPLEKKFVVQMVSLTKVVVT